MQESWHRQEPREVRPFFQTLSAEQALENSAIRLFDGGEVSTETTHDLDEFEFKKLAPSLILDVANPATWLPAGFEPIDIKLVLVARHSFLKRSEVVATSSLAETLPAEWALDPATLARLGDGRNVQLGLALCLGADRPPHPGLPFVEGHWLARKTFSIKSRSTPTLFDVRPRKDEEWVAAGYPAKTLYAVEYKGGIDTELDEGDSVATVYIHYDAHTKMTSSSLGDSLQPVLAAEIIASILVESAKDWQATDAVEPASPLFTILRQLGGEKPMAPAALRALIAKPAHLKAELHARLAVVQSLR